MSSYIFDTNVPDREYLRLRMIEKANDPRTIALLTSIGIQPGWTCLELGPGAGSILHWLGNTVGGKGLVMGIDKQTRHLTQFSQPPYFIQEGDFLEIPLEQTFDLIHGRYVLIHNRTHHAMLDKIFHHLKPGGTVLLEEPDFSSTQLLDRHLDAPHNRVNRAICQMFVDLGLDPTYGLHLPHHMQTHGLHLRETRSDLHLCPGGSPIANVMAESASALTQQYCQTGLCSESDIDQYRHNAHEKDKWAVYHSTTSVIATRPSPP